MVQDRKSNFKGRIRTSLYDNFVVISGTNSNLQKEVFDIGVISYNDVLMESVLR